jgi:predicted nicotinamide N-methyase
VSTPLNPHAERAVEPTDAGWNGRERRLRHLRKAIESSYDTVLQTVVCGGLSIELLRVADVDTLLDRLPKIQFRPDERLPYWADLWPSSLALARYLWEGVNLQGLHVLELGCGLGLAGIAASRKGGVVTFTDYEADALAFTRYNAYRNGCPQATVRHLDWHAPALTQTYAMIIASDVLYERANFHPLVRLVENALGPNGELILAEPNRPIARDFLRLLRDRGFRYARTTERVEVGGEGSEVSIYHGRPGQAAHDHGR